MKKGLLIGIVVLWVGWVIVAVILVPGFIVPTLVGGILLGGLDIFRKDGLEKGNQSIP